MDPCRVSRLVERTAVGEGERDGVKGVGDGSPGSREAEGEGSEGFYIARSGSKLNLEIVTCFELCETFCSYVHLAGPAR
jgi:hypothetical protein